MFELKIYRGVTCHDNEEWCKIWREIDLSFQNWHEEVDKFWPKHSKVSKSFTLMGCFWAKYILFELKSTEDLYFMTLKWGTKFGEEVTCRFKIDIRNLTNFDRVLKSLKTFHFNGLLLSKVCIVLANTVQRSYFSWHWRVMQNLERKWPVVSKLTQGIWQILTWALEVSFLIKVYNGWA